MNFSIKLWNYRSIEKDSPVELEIQEGISFILGINNVGKSNLLKFLYEFRQIFLSNYVHGYQAQIGLAMPFDQIVNRKSPEHGIRFDLHFKAQIIRYRLSPSGDHSGQAATLTVTYTSPNDSSQMAFINFLFRKMFYLGAFRSSITNTSGNSFDISIGQNFINQWIQWADGDNVTHRKRIRQLIEELKILFQFDDFNIRINAGKNNLLVSADGEDFLLTEMGSGISHFIIVLGNVLISQPSLVLIDEPETNLHPRLQETFVRALASKASYGLIATSHSIGLARSVSDRIYSLTKDEHCKSRLLIFGSHFNPTISQSIHEMGYSQFVEIGGSNILLVEGRTDVKVFREVLRKFSADSHFIVLSFGGSNFIMKDESKIVEELAEIKRLNAKSINVIFDSERTSKGSKLHGKFKAFKEVCEKLGFNVLATERHSTENYLTQNAITTIMGSGIEALAPYQKFENSWDKNNNWLIVNEMEQKDFLGTDVGVFIEQMISRFNS